VINNNCSVVPCSFFSMELSVCCIKRKLNSFFKNISQFEHPFNCMKTMPALNIFLVLIKWIAFLLRLVFPIPGRPIKVMSLLLVQLLTTSNSSFCLPTNPSTLHGITYKFWLSSSSYTFPSIRGPKTEHSWGLGKSFLRSANIGSSNIKSSRSISSNPGGSLPFVFYFLIVSSPYFNK